MRYTSTSCCRKGSASTTPTSLPDEHLRCHRHDFLLPGGWLADRFSHRKLLGFSLIWHRPGRLLPVPPGPLYRLPVPLSGSGHHLHPERSGPPCSRRSALLGDETEQGRLSASPRAAAGVVTSRGGVQHPGHVQGHGRNHRQLQVRALDYATVCVAVASPPGSWSPTTSPERTSSNVLKDLLLVIKMPIIWILSLVIFFAGSLQLTIYLRQPT